MERLGGLKKLGIMTLYHGSYTEIREPLVHVGRKSLDFGPGFYATKIREQAEKWARRVCVIRNAATPTLNIYRLEDDALAAAGVRRLYMPAYDQPWLDFIVACRRGQKKWKGYDIIEGGVANDQVIDTVEDYYSGRITVEQALGQLRFAHPTHQMCILRQAVADRFLSFETSIRL